jgi:hypothetical protein
MAAVICGSLAFDTIMTFEGRFSEQILPDQLHILNVSFLVPALRRDFGGCAGNIAYSLKANWAARPCPWPPWATTAGTTWTTHARSWASVPNSCARSTTPTPRRP